ncbi:MAG: NAD(+)/NADH kinase [Chloroflexota bacterium]|nr:NAD(+)/NADH kinase [Chloroflexota bacterium]
MIAAHGLVGIIANPASGKDIRRLVAHGSTFDNNEKINIVRRLLLGLNATRIEQVQFMSDSHAIVSRAARGLDLLFSLTPLSMPTLGNADDSWEAARRLVDLGADVIVTLGGDGTNRVVAKGCGAVPLVPISTGTNNVFPTMVEGTLAGIAAGLIATGIDTSENGLLLSTQPRLDIMIDGELADSALIDVVTTRAGWVGARALWDPEHLSELAVSRVSAHEIGIAGIGGHLFPEAIDGPSGFHAIVGRSETAERQVLAPVAPGLMKMIPIARAALLSRGSSVQLQGLPCIVALDGEREFEILRSNQQVSVLLNPIGPRTVNIAATLRQGAIEQRFTKEVSQATAVATHVASSPRIG